MGATSRPASRSRLRMAAQLAGLALVILLWGAYLQRIWQPLTASEWRVVPGALAGAVAGFGAYFLMLAFGWVMLVRWTGQPLPWGAGARAWAYSMPARYVPGNVWHVAGRVYLGSRLGVDAQALVGASALEQALTLLGAVLLGLAFGLGGVAVQWQGVLVAVGALSLVAIHPRVLSGALALAGRLFHRTVTVARLSYRDTALALAWYALANFAGGVSFWLLVAGFGGTGLGDLPRCVGIYSLAYAVGYLSFVTPAGLGAREAALVALLGGLVSPGAAVGASFLARAASALAEVLAVLGFGLSSRLVVRKRPEKA